MKERLLAEVKISCTNGGSVKTRNKEEEIKIQNKAILYNSKTFLALKKNLIVYEVIRELKKIGHHS